MVAVDPLEPFQHTPCKENTLKTRIISSVNVQSTWAIRPSRLHLEEAGGTTRDADSVQTAFWAKDQSGMESSGLFANLSLRCQWTCHDVTWGP